MAREVVFVDGMRTAFGRRGGSLKDFSGSQLAVIAARKMLEKTQLLERGGVVDSVMCGTAAIDDKATSPARYVALGCGLETASASTVEMQCGSAIDSINHAAYKILAGCADVVIAGGFESHSRKVAPMSTWVQPYKNLGPERLARALSPDANQCGSMTEFADLVAVKYGISRQECDEYAYRSQQRAFAAQSKGYFKEEIAPVLIAGNKKCPDRIFDVDEHLRPETTLESLAGLKPIRGDGFVTTAGNASGMNDGASFVLMMSATKAEELGYKPYAKWVIGADYGVDPRLMSIGPAYSNLIALKRAGLKISDMSVMECNEAFAAQNLAAVKEMENQSGETVEMSKWNPNGGAIAFGHPNGASGARIAIFCMKELERRGGKYGLFSTCCGGGQGTTVIVENLHR